MLAMRSICLLIAVAILVDPARADDEGRSETNPYLDMRFYATAGLFFPDRELRFRLDGSVPAQDSIIDFSERFDLASNDETAAFELGWRFSKNWILRGQYFNVSASSSVTLAEDTQWGDFTFNEGTGIRAGSDVTVTRLFFGRTYRRQGDYELGFGAGLHMLDIGAFIRGQAFINGEDAGFRDAAVDASGPMPNIGAWYVHALSPRWAANVRMDWLDASVDGYDGKIVNAAVGLNYAMTEHFGIGVNYNFFELKFGVRESDWQGRAVSRFDGAYIFLSGYW